MYDIHYTGCLAECKKIEHCLLSILHFLSLCPTMSPDQHTASNPLLRLALSLTVQSMQCVGIFHEYQKEFYQPLLSTLKDGRLVGKLSLEASYALEAISHCNLTPHTPLPWHDRIDRYRTPQCSAHRLNHCPAIERITSPGPKFSHIKEVVLRMHGSQRVLVRFPNPLPGGPKVRRGASQVFRLTCSWK